MPLLSIPANIFYKNRKIENHHSVQMSKVLKGKLAHSFNGNIFIENYHIICSVGQTRDCG